MQLLMRRPEIAGFVSVAPPANQYDFSFLAPCPSSGLIISGSADRVVPPADVAGLADKLKQQKGITITHKTIEGAGHFFDPGMEEMIAPPSTPTCARPAPRADAETTRSAAAEAAGGPSATRCSPLPHRRLTHRMRSADRERSAASSAAARSRDHSRARAPNHPARSIVLTRRSRTRRVRPSRRLRFQPTSPSQIARLAVPAASNELVAQTRAISRLSPR